LLKRRSVVNVYASFRLEKRNRGVGTTSACVDWWAFVTNLLDSQPQYYGQHDHVTVSWLTAVDELF
jgi:hypothetical protein